jgi:hypothetical protein
MATKLLWRILLDNRDLLRQVRYRRNIFGQLFSLAGQVLMQSLARNSQEINLNCPVSVDPKLSNP